MTTRRDVPKIGTFDELFRRYDLTEMKTTAASAAKEGSAHAARADNPHGVTKAQVGLGSVENLSFADYVAKADIVNDLLTGGVDKVLSAEQGKNIASSNYQKKAVYRPQNNCNDNIEEWVLGGGGGASANYPNNTLFWYINTIHFSANAKKQIAYEYRSHSIYTRYYYVGVWSEWKSEEKDILFLEKMKSAIVIENGDFSERMTNYSWGSMSNSWYTDTGGWFIGLTATAQNGGMWQYILNSYVNEGHKLYFSADVKPATTTTAVGLRQDGGYGGTVINPTLLNQWQRVSGIHTVAAAGVNRPYFSFGDTAASGWQQHYLRRVVVLDLTMLYGRGLEPATTTELDFYVALYLNHLNKPSDIKYGINANGEFLAFPSGALIMWGFIQVPPNTSMYTVTYPMTATSAPRPFLQTHWSYTANTFWTTGGITSTTFDVYPRAYNTAVPTTITNAHWYAIGKWRGGPG